MNFLQGVLIKIIKASAIVLTMVSVNAYTSPVGKNVLYSQGHSAGQMEFYVETENCPINTEVGFRAGTPLPGRPLVLPPSKVVTKEPAVYKLIVDIPANWVSNITYYYDLHGMPKGKCEVRFNWRKPTIMDRPR